jgi:hypothetical protein
LETAGVVVTANAEISPDGYQNADLIQYSGASQEIYQNISSTTGGVASIYIKGTLNQTIKFGVLFDESIYTLTGEWQRLTKVFTVTTTRIVINTYSGATARDIYLWGAQVEAGSYATSYIPTTSSSATRVADACSKTGISSLIGQTEGTLFAEVNLTTLQGAVARTFIDIGSSGNRVFLGFTSVASNTIRLQIDTALGNSVVDFRAVVSSTGKIKVAGAYKDGDCALYVNGVAGTLLANGAISFTTISNLFLGQTISSTAILGDGISQALLFKTRLSNTDCEVMTGTGYDSYSTMATALGYTII